MENKSFNLVREKWLPVVQVGPVSLREVFTNRELVDIGGTPMQKIALYKLLLAIAQAAATPKDDDAWLEMGPEGMAKACQTYLEKWEPAFDLYGDKPFLQLAAVKKAKAMPYGAFMPEVATGNTTVLTQIQQEPVLTDQVRALVLLVNQSCCFGGKKVDKSVVLTPGYSKSASAKAGPALCSYGLMHTFLVGSTIWETVWLNLYTKNKIAENKNWSEGVGTPPWEEMPKGEDCEVAKKLKNSLMGRLVPMARFFWLEKEAVHCVEGIEHPDYLHGNVIDPSVTANFSGKKPRVLWVDPTKRPWRSLPSMLAFHYGDSDKSKWGCPTLVQGLERLPKAADRLHEDGDGLHDFGLWCGGVRLSSNSGEQYLTGSDDMLESTIMLKSEWVNDGGWFDSLEVRMESLENMAKVLYAAVSSYLKEMGDKEPGPRPAAATQLFWQSAELLGPKLIEACYFIGEDTHATDKIMKEMVWAIFNAYDTTCPRTTARQLELWTKHRPNMGKWLKKRTDE